MTSITVSGTIYVIRFIHRHCSQSATKSFRRIGLKLGELGHNNGQDILDQVSRIGRIQPLRLSSVKDERRIVFRTPIDRLTATVKTLAAPNAQLAAC